MAQIDIGKLTFTHKGDYAGGTAYVANDVVYYNGSAYIAKTSTTGNLPTSTAHWNTFAAGSGGIWNAGLSLGTAGQVVKVNSGASALEFGTVSSDYVKLGETTLGSDTTYLTFDNLFTSDYTNYHVYYWGYGDQNGGWINGRFIDSAGNEINSNTTQLSQRATVSSSGGANSQNDSWNGDRLYLVQNSNTASKQNQIYMVIHNPLNTTAAKMISYIATGWDGTATVHSAQGSGIWDSTGAMRGFKFYCHGGTMKAGSQIKIYGVK